MTIRTVWEVYEDNNASTRIRRPDIVDISVVDDYIRFHLENGTLLDVDEYKLECEKKLGFLGFSGLFILDTEATLSELRLSEFQLYHRLALLRPRHRDDFALCGLIYAVENLPLSRKLLVKIDSYLRKMQTSCPVSTVLKATCLGLAATCQYVFFDDETEAVSDLVPAIIKLYVGIKKANATVVKQAFFNDYGDGIQQLSLAYKTLRGGSVPIIEMMSRAFDRYHCPKRGPVVSSCSARR